MEYQELIKILEEQNPDSEVKHCSICGVPFIPYNSRQKTCAEKECQKALHDAYIKEYAKTTEHQARMQEARIKYRLKKKAEKTKMENLDKVEAHWKKQREFDEKIKEYGDHYGEVQKQKILSGIPKINTEL